MSALLTTQNTHNLLPVAALLIGATIWGLLWYPYRLLEQAGIGGPVAVTITYLVAFLLGMVVFYRHLGGLRHSGRRIVSLFWIALFVGVANLAYVLGVIHGEVMRVLLLFYLAPLWTVLFSRMLLDEKLSTQGYWVIGLSLAGAAVMLWKNDAGGFFLLPASYADWMGLTGGFMFALSNVLIRRDQHHSIQLKSLAVWAGVAMVGLVCSLLMTISFQGILLPQHWGLLLFVGGVVFALSLVVQYGLTHMLANQASVILLFEIVVAAVAAWLLANETMTSREWIGGVMIVSAGLFSARMNQS